MAKRQRSEAQKAARRADYSAMTSEERVAAKLAKANEYRRNSVKHKARVRAYRSANLAIYMVRWSWRWAARTGNVGLCHGMSLIEAATAVQTWLDRKPVSCEHCGSVARLVLDHNHKTGRIRAWLCRRCNSFEGLIASGVIARLEAFIKSRDE
jgi:hypothetical protein